MAKVFKNIIHIGIIIFLTLLTQVGGVIWLIVFVLYKTKKRKEPLRKRLVAFIIIYLICSLIIVPLIAPLGGRQNLPLTKSGTLGPQTILTVILNRHYVNTHLYQELEQISRSFNEATGLKVIYLDANFPFLDGFPLLPHISHNDGKKVDLSFIYNFDGNPSDLKPARSGYGAYVRDAIDNPNYMDCITKNRIYGMAKYLTFGSRTDLEFNKSDTQKLLEIIASRNATQKILLEEYLENEMIPNHPKVRFQGCHSVRHDDHIHMQIR